MRGRHTTPACLLLFLLLLGSLQAQTVFVLHAYDLTSSLSDQNGGAALIAHGGTITGSGYSFAAGQGLQLTTPLPDPATYTLVLDFTFDAVNGYRKIVDFQSRGPDSGYYTLNGHLNYYPVITGGPADIVAGQSLQVVISRDGVTGQVTGYVNGVQDLNFTDSGNLAVLTSNANGLYFFMDDFATGQGEVSGGLATRILIFDQALSPTQVLALAQGQLPLSVPEPATVWLLLLGAGLIAGTAWRRTRRR